jgi:hypothetical protein
MKFALTGNTKDEIVQVLMEKFSLGKTSVYNKFKLLEISITKQGKIFGLSQEDLDNFQGLEDWLQAGNSTNTYSPIANKSAIVQSSSGELEENSTYLHSENIQEPAEILQLIRAGQEKGAGALIAQNMIAQQVISNPDSLPEDLRQAVYRSEVAIAPKSVDPMKYANRFLQFMNLQESQAA